MDDLLTLQVWLDAERVDGHVRGVGETGNVRSRYTGSNIHVDNVVAFVHQHPQSMHADATRFVLPQASSEQKRQQHIRKKQVT